MHNSRLKKIFIVHSDIKTLNVHHIALIRNRNFHSFWSLFFSFLFSFITTGNIFISMKVTIKIFKNLNINLKHHKRRINSRCHMTTNIVISSNIIIVLVKIYVNLVVINQKSLPYQSNTTEGNLSQYLREKK